MGIPVSSLFDELLRSLLNKFLNWLWKPALGRNKFLKFFLPGLKSKNQQHILYIPTNFQLWSKKFFKNFYPPTGSLFGTFLFHLQDLQGLLHLVLLYIFYQILKHKISKAYFLNDRSLPVDQTCKLKSVIVRAPLRGHPKYSTKFQQNFSS